eukprot:2994166-Prymnesium_polylepis.1
MDSMRNGRALTDRPELPITLVGDDLSGQRTLRAAHEVSAAAQAGLPERALARCRRPHLQH